PGAVGAEEAEDLTGTHVERHAVDRGEVAEATDQVLHFDDGHPAKNSTPPLQSRPARSMSGRMAPHPLTQRLRAQARIDVDAALVEFRKKTGSCDPDAFLIYLRDERMISDDLFRELHGADPIALAQLVKVTPDRTLLVERPSATLLLP